MYANACTQCGNRATRAGIHSVVNGRRGHRCVYTLTQKHAHTQNGATRSGADDTEN